MYWNIERTVPFVPPLESSLSFLYNYNNYTYSGMEANEVAMGETQQRLLPVIDDEMNNGNDYGEKKKKKTKYKKIKLTSHQVESLERSFQEEIKLEPETKMKLSRELGLQPRQIAVWFQNRRTRWRTKQLEHSYDVLKHSYDVLQQENQKLKEKVVELTEKHKEKAHPRTQAFGDESVFEGFGEIEGYYLYQRGTTTSIQQAAEGYNNSSFIIEDFDLASLLQECHWP